MKIRQFIDWLNKLPEETKEKDICCVQISSRTQAKELRCVVSPSYDDKDHGERCILNF